MLAFLVLLKFENTLDGQIYYFNFDSKHDKCKCSSKLIGFLTVSNLLPLEVVKNINIAIFLYYGKTL